MEPHQGLRGVPGDECLYGILHNECLEIFQQSKGAVTMVGTERWSETGQQLRDQGSTLGPELVKELQLGRGGPLRTLVDKRGRGN